MTAAPALQDVAAFQVFIWNKRRYAIPVNAQGEHLGPALPFRNLNRTKRNGYGPGSGNTTLLEDTVTSSSSPLLSPVESSVDTPAGGSHSFPNASFESRCDGSSPGRSSRLRLSRTVSFIDKTTSAAEDGKDTPGVADPAAPQEAAPPSILQKKSSFRVTLRPLFDFDFEPPHTPREVAVQRASTEEQGGEREEEHVKGAARGPETATAAPHLQTRPSSSSPPVTALPTTHTRPRTPPLPHSKSALATHFVRNTNNSVPAGGAGEAPLIPLDVTRRPLDAGSPPQLSPPSTSITKLMFSAAAEICTPPIAAAAAPTTSASPAAELTSPPTPQRSPSPSKTAMALARTTIRSPPPDDLFYMLRYQLGPATPQGEVKVAAAASPTTPANNKNTSTTSIPPLVRDSDTTTDKTTAAPHHARRKGHRTPHRSRKKEKGRDGSATAALSKDTPAQQNEVNGHVTEKQKQEVSTRSRPPTTTPTLVLKCEKMEDATHELPEIVEDDNLAPKYSDFLSPPKTSAVAATTAASSSAPSGAAAAPATPASKSGSIAAPVAHSYSPEPSSSRVGSALGNYAQGHRRDSTSPSAQSNGDFYDLFRYVTPQPTTPTKDSTREAIAQRIDPPPAEKSVTVAPATTTTTTTAAAAPAAGAPPPPLPAVEVLGPLQPGASATNYDFHCSLVELASTQPTRPKSPRTAPPLPAPLRRHTISEPCKPQRDDSVSHTLLPLAATAPPCKGAGGAQRPQGTANGRVTLPPVSPRAGGTPVVAAVAAAATPIPLTRRRTTPQAFPVPTLTSPPQRQPPQQQQQQYVVYRAAHGSSMSPNSVFTFDSDDDGSGSLVTNSDGGASWWTASGSTRSHSTAGEEDDDGSSARTFSDVASDAASDGADYDDVLDCRSGVSGTPESLMLTNASKTSGTTRTSATTTNTTTSSSSDFLETRHGSIWSTMMRRLRKPLLARPSTEEDTLMYQLNRYRNRRALEKSRVYYGSRVETVRANGMGSRLSSVEAAGPTDPLQHRRREKKEPHSEPTSTRRRWS